MTELDAITERILGCAFKVSTGLGPGFLEKLYEKDDSHLAQNLNYLRACQLPACLLLNFGQPKLEIRRLAPSPAWPKPTPEETQP